jgi:PAS domain S-box-containing protein
VLSRIPTWFQPLACAIVGTGLITAGIAAVQHFGTHVPLLAGILFIFAFFAVYLGSAWLGYSGGILVCVLTTFVVPHLVVLRSARNGFDPLRFGLLIAFSLTVSYIGSSYRRRESDLRREARELERRVRDRSEELLLSALEKRQAEDRLGFVLDSADIGYWDFDLQQGSVVRSPKHDLMFGYPEPQPRWDYQKFLSHIHPDDRDSIDRQLRTDTAEGNCQSEFRIVWPDGSVRWLWSSARTHCNGSGAPAHISGVIVDVTARRRAEDALREQAQLLDLAHEAIVSIDQDCRIRFWNRGAEQMYGYSRAEALGAVVHDLLQTQFPEPLDDIQHRAAEDGHWEGELVHTCKDGTRLAVASRWATRLGPRGEKLGWLEINGDITERRRIEEQLRHTQKLESLGVLAGGVAHDFNNLLTGILGNASLALDRSPESHPNRVLLEEVMHAAERAADLTRQLLAYAGKGRFIMRNIDLPSLVRELSGLVQTSIPKTVQLRLQLDSVPAIYGDPGQMQQIVMNLVINAAEAIGPDGGTVLVRTGLQTVDQQYLGTMSSSAELLHPGGYVMLEVHDTGCGMSQETLKKIFDPFFTTKFAGRGLGLSAVLGIVRAHHGALKVYSEPGRGTTFKVLFPMSREVTTVGPVETRGDLAGTGTVLIVDDEEVVRRTASHALERYGYRTILAVNGREALDIYQSAPRITLVLLDLTMPVMSGEETLRRLQTMDPAVRVLLTSGYNEVEAVQRFAGKGLAGFIQKPYTAADLAERVKQVMVPSEQRP